MDARLWKRTWFALVMISSLLMGCLPGQSANPSAVTKTSPSEMGSKTTVDDPVRTLTVDPNQQAFI